MFPLVFYHYFPSAKETSIFWECLLELLCAETLCYIQHHNIGFELLEEVVKMSYAWPFRFLRIQPYIFILSLPTPPTLSSDSSIHVLEIA